MALSGTLLSLFTSGMKMRLGLHDRRWFPPPRLALGSMVATVVLITAAGVWLLGLPLGVAVLLGGILAPTDPVLATEVQVDNATDRDQLRFALTGEGGLNDGTAFPVVMLGLGLLGVHDLGALGWRWMVEDVLWATSAGIAIGAVLGTGLGRLVLHLRHRHRHHEAIGCLCFAIGHGLPSQHVETLVELTTAVVVVTSIVVHGVSVTPLMARYRHLSRSGRARPG